MAIGAYRLANELKPDFPDLSGIVRFASNNELTITHHNKTFIENKFAYVDDDVFQMFSFKLLSGNSETALKDPFTVVITEEAAQKFFGSDRRHLDRL